MEQSNFPANNKDCNHTEFGNLRVGDFIEIFYRLTYNFAKLGCPFWSKMRGFDCTSTNRPCEETIIRSGMSSL